MKARGWEGTDGSTTALIVTESGKVILWSNLGEWLELSTEFDPWAEAQSLAESWELAPMHPDRVNALLGVPMTDDEMAGWGDSQER